MLSGLINTFRAGSGSDWSKHMSSDSYEHHLAKDCRSESATSLLQSLIWRRFCDSGFLANTNFMTFLKLTFGIRYVTRDLKWVQGQGCLFMWLWICLRWFDLWTCQKLCFSTFRWYLIFELLRTHLVLVVIMLKSAFSAMKYIHGTVTNRLVLASATNSSVRQIGTARTVFNKDTEHVSGWLGCIL